MILIILLAVISLAINYIIAVEMESIAESKGCKTSRRYFWFCFLLGLPGWIMVVALPNHKIENLLLSLKNTNKQDQHNSNATSSNVLEKKESPNPEADNINPVITIVVDAGKIKCPKCGTIQNSNRLVCWECGARFVVKE